MEGVMAGTRSASAVLLTAVFCLLLPTAWASLCPYGGWQRYRNSCYYFYNANYSRTWGDARQRCLEQDADLVTLDSTGERDWVLNQVKQRMSFSHNTHTKWWTGLNARPDGSTWSWPNSTNVNMAIFNNKWATGQPKKDSGHQCVEIQSLKFSVARCTDAYQAICERPIGRPLTCDIGWTLFAGQCYRFYTSRQTFQGARGICHRNGGTLPQVFDSATQTVLWDLARTKGQNLWVSLQSVQQGHSYGWRWDNGTMLTQPTYWYHNLPRTLGANVNTTCVEQLPGQATTKSWNLIPCNSHRQFFCQKPEGMCPDGWLQLTNRCFFIYTHDAMSFSDAQSYCSARGSSLAALDSSDVNTFLYPYVHNARAAGASTLWIGLTDNNQNQGPWKWVSTNRPVGRWTNWPNNRATNTPGKQDCVSIDSNDRNLRWHPTATCSIPRRFICQLPVNKALKQPTTAPVHMTCPPGYMLYGPLQSCIRLFSQDKTWSQASAACNAQRRKAHLVIIPNRAFSNFIKARIRTHRGKYWIGLQDQQQENTFHWLNTNTSVSFTDWSRGQPNSQGHSANCVAIFDQSNYKWNEVNCNSRYHYICQTDATVNGPTQQPATTQRTWSTNCGPYWETAPSSYSCYMFNSRRMSWMDARADCQHKGGDLVSITSLSEQSYITGRISSSGISLFWIGANDRQVESGWKWSDSSPMAFINWKPGEPNNRANSDCVGIASNDGRWSDFSCATHYSYICEKMGRSTPKPTPGLTSPATVPSGKTWGCPRGWRGFNGQCYIFGYAHRIVWSDANTRCRQLGGTLASIHSDADNKFVFSLYPRGFNKQSWIGLNDQAQEGSFLWTDLSPVTYTAWNNHEPNNINNEDCVVMYHNGKWTDYKCTSTGVDGFFCQKPMSLQNIQDQMMAQGCAYGLGFRAQCYAYITTPKSWQNAQTDCQHRHGNLATINDRHIQAFVSAELVTRTGTYWIGLKSPGPQNTSYVWATGYDVDYTSWSESHTGNERGSCVAMGTGRPVGLWTNYQCRQHLPYICQIPRHGFTTPPPTPPSTTSRISCPHGWKDYRNICIMAFNLTLENRLSWMESRSYCQSLGGDLLSVWSKNMANQILSRVIKDNTKHSIWWIGLNDRGSESGHVWSDGHGVTYTNWNPGEPNDYNHREDCVEWTLPRNGWNDDNCYVARNFICSIPRGTVLTTTAPPPTGVTGSMCKNDSWVYFAGQCYYFSPQEGDSSQLTWYEARRTCLSMGSDLASVHSIDENGFLTSSMSRHSAWTFWIGLNDLDKQGYSWTDGEAVNFVSWHPNEPNDAFGQESCVKSTSSGDWKDTNCQDKNAYICERPVNGFVSQQPTEPPVYGDCPSGFTSIPILPKCYKVFGLTNNTRKNFKQAAQACSQMMTPGSLVSIHNYIEQTYVMTLIAGLPHFVWIGLNDMKRRNYFEWYDSSEVDYTHWGHGQPDENLHSNNPDDRRDCVGMNPKGRYAGNWNDLQCRNLNHYICQIQRVTNGQTLPPALTGCPSGYTKHLSNCYKFHKSSSSWGGADSVCRQEKALLVTFATRFQMSAVSLLRRPDQQHMWDPSPIWIGLTMQQSNTAFQWVNQWPVKFTRWGSNEPSNNGTCVIMDAKNEWHTQSCNSMFPFVCQISIGGPPPTTTTVSGVCPQDGLGTWHPQGEYCYQLVTQTQHSWSDSRYACSLMGGSLASVHSQQEMGFIFGLFTQAVSRGADSTVNVWIGLSKGFSDGFSWSDGTETEFDNWDAGEPSDTDNGLHQDCVQADITSGKWNDVDCFDTNYYVCKTLKVVSTTVHYGTAPAVVTQTPNAGIVGPQRPTQRSTYGPGGPGLFTGGRLVNTQGPGVYTPQPQTGTGSSGGSSGLSGGGVAGVVLGTLAIIAIAVVAIFFLRGRLPLQLQRGPRLTSGASGFDNALYSKAAEERDGKGSVVFDSRQDVSASES